MGREVKIVSLDFDWFETQKEEDEIWSKTWEGYLFEQEFNCFLCGGSGNNSKGKECPLCFGDGKITPRFEPPKSWDDKRNGFQIWQDVSEGSPISPVFKKAEDLAEWMVKNDTSTSRGTSYKAWLKMIKEIGSAPSGILSSEGYKDGMSLYEEKND
jgi:hypothetical protein